MLSLYMLVVVMASLYMLRVIWVVIVLSELLKSCVLSGLGSFVY